MATAEPATRPQEDRHKGRRPFASWMKRLTNLKNPHNDKKTLGKKRNWNGKNNPYPESGFVSRPPAPSTNSGRNSSVTPASLGSGRVNSFNSYEDSTRSGRDAPMRSNKSTAPTLATNAETVHSDTGFSRAGTTHTDGIYSGSGRANSVFSSRQGSQESLTTTLTTIHSTAPSNMAPNNQAAANQAPSTFSHQYPVSPPASAVPGHLAPQPHSYSQATANGLLTDDASILTLASSTKRRRRNSLDTNASVRAIAPSSVWGNSRESLPLSVLSANIDRDVSSSGTPFATGGPVGRPSLSGIAAERASVYSNSGVGAPALVSERNSYYSTKQAAIDSVSVRSGHLGFGHGRSESINGSISGHAGVAASPLASPRDPEMPGRNSRRASGWKDGDVEEETEVESSRESLDRVDGEETEIGKKKEPKGKGKVSEPETAGTPISRRSTEGN